MHAPNQEEYIRSTDQRVGTSKVEVVRRAKNQQYDPKTDYYKRLREAIIEFHYQGSTLPTSWKGLVNQKKVANFDALSLQYASWLNGNIPKSNHIGPANWSSGALDIRVNPEVSFTMSGVSYIVKLYFKADPIPQHQSSIILHLMEHCYRPGHPNHQIGIFDLRRSKFLTGSLNTTMQPWLAGEAAAWLAIFPHV